MNHVVLDLEMCQVPKGVRGSNYDRKDETIQIGAVCLDDEYQIVDTFNCFVKPAYGKLDSFIRKLTGITWNDLKEASDFETVLKQFTDWIPEGEVEMISWSETDKIQISGEMKAKGINNDRMSELITNWTDSQKMYAEKIHKARCFSLEEALFTCDIDIIGKAHDGFSDAYNTALLYKKMMAEQELQLNELYVNAKYGETKHLECTLGDLLSGFKWPDVAVS